MFNKPRILAAAAAVAAISMAGTAQARDQIKIVGSSTVYPFATVVAEKFGKSTPFKTPVVESTGSGGGLKLFCAGAGERHPDITNASRRIKASEVKRCAKNGITDIIEVKVGYDGIVLANSKKTEALTLTLKDVFLALARDVPAGDGKTIANPYKTWKDVNATLPDTRIGVLGPPPSSGTSGGVSGLPQPTMSSISANNTNSVFSSMVSPFDVSDRFEHNYFSRDASQFAGLHDL